MMTGEELLQRLAAMTPEQRKHPVVFDYYTDEEEMWRHKPVDFVGVGRAHYGLPECIRLSDEKSYPELPCT